MKRFLIALQFFTILPIKIKAEIKNKDFGDSLIYFPVVGALIGMFLVLISFCFVFLPHLVIVALVLIGSIVITGGIHLDGLADTCDGFYASKSKEKILQIMRDSHIGAMGVIAIVSVLLLKFTLLAGLTPNILYMALIMMVAFGRYAQVIACYVSDYAHKEGKAKNFIEYSTRKGFFLAGIFTLALFLLLLGLKMGLALFGLSLIPVYLFINYIKRRIGAMTGDTIGATSEIAEISVLFLILIWQRQPFF